MSIRTALIDAEDGAAVEVGPSFAHAHGTEGQERALMTTNPVWRHSVFKSAEYSGAGTISLIQPNDEGSLILADLVVTSDKVQNGSVEIQWTDDTDTAIIIKPSTNDAPVVVPLAFRGRVQGWKDARIDVIITGPVNGSVLATYVKIPGGLPFAEWDALR